MTSIPFPYLVSKRHALSPSLVGDSQRNHWLWKNHTNRLVDKLCYITWDQMIVSVYFTSIIKKFAIRSDTKRMDALSVKSNT